MKIGFIGLGAMGLPMAACVQKSGFQIVVAQEQDNGAPAAQLLPLGAEVVERFCDVMQASDLLITMLPADKEINEVYLGPDGIILHAAKGCTCLDLTSAKGSTIVRVAEAIGQARPDMRVLDGAVSGGTEAAEKGTLTIMTAGDQALLESLSPVLEAMGKSIFYCGGVGGAKNIKIINQLLNAGNTCVMAEAMFLAEQWGLDIDLLTAVIAKSSGNSWVFQNNYPKFMQKGVYDGGFRLSLMIKDILPASESGFTLPVSAAVRNSLSACGKDKDKNYNIVFEAVKEMNHQGMGGGNSPDE